jgi:hypothetical protein
LKFINLLAGSREQVIDREGVAMETIRMVPDLAAKPESLWHERCGRAAGPAETPILQYYLLRKEIKRLAK